MINKYDLLMTVFRYRTIYSIKENDMVKYKLRKKTLHREYNLNSTKQYIL